MAMGDPVADVTGQDMWPFECENMNIGGNELRMR